MTFSSNKRKSKDEDYINSLLKEQNTSNILNSLNFDEEVENILKESQDIYGSNINYDPANINIDLLLNSADLEFLNQDKKKNIDQVIIPDYKNNIEFVKYFEFEYLKMILESIKMKDKIYILKTYKQNMKKSKLSVLNIILKKTISDKLYKLSQTKFISSIAAFQDMIFCGNSVGQIRMLTCETEHELKTLSNKEIEGTASVTSISISSDGEFLAAGYKNGFVILWEIANAKSKKVISGIQKGSILDIKLIISSKKRWDIISSSCDSTIQHYIIKDGILNLSVDNTLLIKEPKGYSFHQIISFNISQTKANDLNVPTLFANSTFLGFSCMEYVSVYLLEKKIMLMNIQKPSYLKIIPAPECSFGYGFIPDECYHDDNTTEADKGDCISLSSTFTGQLPGVFLNKETKLKIIFSISWGKVINLYSIDFKSSKSLYFKSVSHFINSSPIIRMDFLSESIIFIFDTRKLCKIVNTTMTIPGDVKIDFSSEIPIPIIPYKFSDEIDEGQSVDNNIDIQTDLYDPNTKSNIFTFSNTIVSTMKNIFVLGRDKFHHLKLLNWEQYLIELSNNSDWEEAFCLGLDIYYGRNNALADIPSDLKVREIKVKTELEHLIYHYAVLYTANGNNNINNIFVEKLEKCINICIEFCLELCDLEYLLNTLQPLFDSKGFGDIFINKLEPFILNDSRLTSHLQTMTTSKIIDSYIKTKKIIPLNQILLHLDVNSMNVEIVKEYCRKYELFTPYIYINTYNSISEDYITPLNYLWEKSKEAEFIKDFKEYSEYIETIGIKTLNPDQITKSKNYLLHKILFYLNLCFKCKKLKGDSISPNIQSKVIFEILKWLFLDDVERIDILIGFDSKSFFIMFENVFKEEKTKKIIDDLNKNVEFYKEIQRMSQDNPNANMIFSLSSLLEYLITRSKQLRISLRYVYDFVIKISNSFDLLKKEQKIEAAKYLLGVNKNDDLYKIKSDSEYKRNIDELSHEIIQMIMQEKSFTNQDFISLLSVTDTSPYIMVKVYLLKELKNFKECLITLIKSDINSIPNREKVIFDWISDTLYDLHQIGDPNFQVLKNEVLENLHLLSDMNIEFISKIVEKWFENDQLFVINKLDKVKHLQLKYVESVLDKFKEEADYNQTSTKKAEQYQSLLSLHIRLLCKLNPERVLFNLTKRGQVYPVHECLEACLEYKVYDGAIYLKQALGEIEEALSIAKSLLDKSYEDFIKQLRTEIIQERQYNQKRNDFLDKLKLCTDILEKNSDKTDYTQDPQMWFSLLDKLYEFYNLIKKEIESGSCVSSGNEENLFVFGLKISDEIKSLLEKMCSYVRIYDIISNVTDKYRNAEFKEFKALLLKILSSYSHQKNILQSANNLLSNSVLYSVIEQKKLNSKGCPINIYKCDQCEKLFNQITDESIFSFFCGHKFHLACCLQNGTNEPICEICRKNEFDYVSSIDHQGSIDNSLPRKEYVFDNDENALKNGRNENNLMKLKEMERIFSERETLITMTNVY